MVEESVECPNCGTRIPLTAVVTASIEARLRKQLASEVEKREQAANKREAELKASEKQLGDRVDELLREQLDEQTPKLKDRLRRDLQEERKEEFDELQNRLRVKEERLKLFENREREIVTKEEEIQERERRLTLDAKRALDRERETLVEKVRGEEVEKWQGRLSEKEIELGRVKQALDRAQRVGVSGELVGEVAERTLEERLTDAFGEDQVAPIGRGKHGGDVLQTVTGGGSILWESKDRYENWSNDWIPKLKRDRDDAKASIGVLVTTVGPGSKPIRSSSYEDGVVLSPPGLVIGVASLLRPMLGEIARQRRLYGKQESLQEAVYAWVTSQGFKNGIVAIAENLRTLEHEVGRAKVNHAKWFKKMEVGVELTTRALAEFYGSAQGQARLPDLPVLSLDGGSSASANRDEGVTEDADLKDDSVDS
nr:DUF2130 domain-containing protein [Ferrimicrobium acidiphilum]